MESAFPTARAANVNRNVGVFQADDVDEHKRERLVRSTCPGYFAL
jgi:hypothetical protein